LLDAFEETILLIKHLEIKFSKACKHKSIFAILEKKDAKCATHDSTYKSTYKSTIAKHRMPNVLKVGAAKRAGPSSVLYM
jgi:hypothetical protein